MIKKIVVVFASLMPSMIRKSLYRLIGYKIGKNVKIGPLTILIAENVHIMDNVQIGALNLFKLKNIKIGEDSVIRSMNMFVGENSLTIGKRTQITGPFVFMNLAENITIGDESGIGSHTLIYTHGALLPYLEGEPRKFEEVKIGSRTWVHASSIILPGTKIGNSSIIFAGSVVNSSYPDNSFLMGNPAKLISTADKMKTLITPKERVKRMEEILYEFSKKVLADKKEFKDKNLIISRNKKKMSIVIGNKPKEGNYSEVILFGYDIPNPKDKKISFFDVKKRKMRIVGNLALEFHHHLEKYAEYFKE